MASSGTALTLYTLANCDTCREAAKWLRARGEAFTERAIRETPPSLAELRAMLAVQGGEVRKLFNTAGREFRALGLAEKLPAMSEGEALALLSQNGSLVKRPFLIGRGVGVVGFDATRWKTALERAHV
jgi:arsenate reductase (glutaredoxin)